MAGGGDAVPGPFRRNQGSRCTSGPRHPSCCPREGAGRAPAAEIYVVGYPRLLPDAGLCRGAGFTGATPPGRCASPGCSTARCGRRRRTSGRRTSTSIRRRRGTTTAGSQGVGQRASGRDFGAAAAFHPFLVGMRETARTVYETVTGETAPPLEGSAAPPDEAGVVLVLDLADHGAVGDGRADLGAEAGDGAGLVGLERLLHLHRLEHDDDVALRDRVALARPRP